MLHWLYFILSCPSFIHFLFEFCGVNLKANSYVSLFISGGNGGPWHLSCFCYYKMLAKLLGKKRLLGSSAIDLGFEKLLASVCPERGNCLI